MSATRSIIIIVVLGAVFLSLGWFYSLGPFTEHGCPPDKCTFDRDAVAVFELEPGRTREDHGTSVPTGFPQDLPVDPNPIRVETSYTEVSEQENDGEPQSYTQSTYSYVTSQSVDLVLNNFENYFSNNGLIAIRSSFVTAIMGIDDTSSPTQTINVSIASQSRYENLITVSIIDRNT